MHKFSGKFIFFWRRDMPKKADIPRGREKPFDQNILNGIFVLGYKYRAVKPDKNRETAEIVLPDRR